MKKELMFTVLVAVLAVPMVSHAETAQECASNCVEQCSGGGTVKDDDIYKNCLHSCLNGCYGKPTGVPDVPPPTPVPSSSKSGLDSSMLCAEMETESTGKIVVASAYDDFDLPCYVGGKYVRNCSRNKPYYNAFNGDCYATLDDCKKADGDMSSASGSGGCVRCGK